MQAVRTKIIASATSAEMIFPGYGLCSQTVIEIPDSNTLIKKDAPQPLGRRVRRRLPW